MESILCKSINVEHLYAVCQSWYAQIFSVTMNLFGSDVCEWNKLRILKDALEQAFTDWTASLTQELRTMESNYNEESLNVSSAMMTEHASIEKRINQNLCRLDVESKSNFVYKWYWKVSIVFIYKIWLRLGLKSVEILTYLFGKVIIQICDIQAMARGLWESEYLDILNIFSSRIK